jgi:hypothetical protein
MNSTEIVKTIRILNSEHKNYWQGKSAEMRKYREAYQTRFWRATSYDPQMIRVETPDGHVYIESYIASLFSRAPAVVVGRDVAANTGDPEAAQAVANRWLFEKRESIENASRLALIYDYSALKVVPQESDDVLERADIIAIPPWEVIVDREASNPQSARYIGHTYWMNLQEAKKRWGSKKFVAEPKQDYFDTNGGGAPDYRGQARKSIDDLPDTYLFIKVVELYDFVNDAVYFWSPNWKLGDELLEQAQIPLRTYDDKPISPIRTLYYSRIPDCPMEGISAMSRVYDMLYEKNILRTYWANSVRRDSRQYLYREGALDEEALAKVTAGVDGAMIAVDNESLDGIIREVPITPISSNFDRYAATIEADLNKGAVLSNFQGEPTKATATEITAIASYAASEMGKMARERDSLIEGVVNVYLRTLSLLADEGEKAIVEVGAKGMVVDSSSLNAKFKIVALDQGSQPLADAIKKQNLVALLPTLQSLGVPGNVLLEEIVRSYELPKNFLEAAQAQLAAVAPQGPIKAPTTAAANQLEGGPTEQKTAAEQIAEKL